MFEVDHPATQAVKKAKLETIFDSLPGLVTFVPLDFQQEVLGPRLFAKGYDKNLKTLFIWEGVTKYLNPDTVDKILSFVAENAGSGSSIVFDFTTPEVVQGIEERPEAIAWLKKTSDSGEPLKFSIRFDALESLLAKRRFGKISFATDDFLNRAYFNRLEDKRVATPILAIVHASLIT